MKRLFVKTLLIGLTCLPLLSWTEDRDADHDDAYRLKQSGEILSLETILANLKKDYDGKVLEVEMEREHSTVIYEIKILSRDGVLRELKVDAHSGRVISRKEDD